MKLMQRSVLAAGRGNLILPGWFGTDTGPGGTSRTWRPAAPRVLGHQPGMG